MRLAVLVSVLCLVLGLSLASTSDAQEAPLDLGEPSALVAACQHLTPIGEMGGIVVRSCRRISADVVDGNRAWVHVRLATNQGTFEFQVALYKSLWSVNGFLQQ